MAQVLTIVAVRPASLTAFFKKQHASQGAAPANACEVPRLLANALPLVLHSLQAHTGNPTFPPSFLEWLVLSCVAAAAKCAEAMTGTLDHTHDVRTCQKCRWSLLLRLCSSSVICNGKHSNLLPPAYTKSIISAEVHCIVSIYVS